MGRLHDARRRRRPARPRPPTPAPRASTSASRPATTPSGRSPRSTCSSGPGIDACTSAPPRWPSALAERLAGAGAQVAPRGRSTLVSWEDPPTPRRDGRAALRPRGSSCAHLPGRGSCARRSARGRPRRSCDAPRRARPLSLLRVITTMPNTTAPSERPRGRAITSSREERRPRPRARRGAGRRSGCAPSIASENAMRHADAGDERAPTTTSQQRVPVDDPRERDDHASAAATTEPRAPRGERTRRRAAIVSSETTTGPTAPVAEEARDGRRSAPPISAGRGDRQDPGDDDVAGHAPAHRGQPLARRRRPSRRRRSCASSTAGSRSATSARITAAPAPWAAKPWAVSILMMRLPIVLMIRQPPT